MKPQIQHVLVSQMSRYAFIETVQVYGTKVLFVLNKLIDLTELAGRVYFMSMLKLICRVYLKHLLYYFVKHALLFAFLQTV